MCLYYFSVHVIILPINISHTFPVEQFQITLATEPLLLWSFCDHKLQQHKERKNVHIGTRATVPQVTPTSMAFRVGGGMIKSIFDCS
jgi:hypothetical protein